MTDPILIEVTRGPLVESRHRGAIAIVDAAGRLRASIGDVAQRVFPRSAVKALQALPLVESGAADRYGFGDAELALACASHNGEPRHVATATAMLAAAGRSPDDLECGPQLPSSEEAAIALGARRQGAFGPPQQLLRQACRLHLPRLPSWSRPGGLCRSRPSRPARNHRRARRDDR